MRFLLGGYSADMGGAASGVGLLLAGAPDDHLAGGSLGYAGEVAHADSPSWLAQHPGSATLSKGDVVYAALEKTGAVQAFRRTGDASFTPLGEPVAAGDATCHVAVSPDGGALVASCWGDGRVVHMKVDAAGRPHTPVAAARAVDPYGPDAPPQAGDLDLAAAARALRAAAGEEFAHLVPDVDDEPSPDDEDARPSRAHAAAFLPGGVVATTDLGLDLVRFWRAGTGLTPAGHVVLPRGSGPRHLAWHPSGHLYVVTEASREVFVLAWSQAAREWRIVSACALGPTLETDAAAEIALSRDAAFVYAGVRGSDTLATLRVGGDGDRLAPVALVDAGVNWPRHHVVVRDTLLVAGERSNDVVSFTLDERTGVPGRVRHRTPAPSPTCVLPLT